MIKVAAIAVAVGLFAAMPSFTTPANATSQLEPNIKLAQADVSIRVGNGYRHHNRSHHRHHWRHHRACSTKVIWRNGRKTVIKRCG